MPSQSPSRSELTSGFTIAAGLMTLFCVAALGYLAGIRQADTSPGAAAKTYRLDLNGLHLHLTAGTMGLAVIFVLVVLLGLAIFFAMIARRRRHSVGAVSLQAESSQALLT